MADNPVITNLDKRILEMGDNKFRTGILLSGEVVVKGQVIGFVSASQKLKETASASVDGSEFARAIAFHDVDASGGDKPITYIYEGDVDDSLLVFNGGDTLVTVVAGQPDSYKEMLHGVSILANTYENDQVQDNQ